MIELRYTKGLYHTSKQRLGLLARLWPSLVFYSKWGRIIIHASALARRGRYTDQAWCRSSIDILQAMESVGGRFEISGIEHVQALDGPAVIMANHMSMLETMVLPIMIQPIRPVTFIVKQGLLEYPVFKHIMRARDPIAVTRDNPRADLKAVLDGGRERLDKGISIIVFPQTTRTIQFDPEQFTSIGLKLAQKAKVPIVPLALKTDIWCNGKLLKDFGKIDTSHQAHFAFDTPIEVQGRGGDELQRIIDFIQGKLSQWQEAKVISDR